ncbi:MAG: GGDEF domain-containing protein [Deferribacteraceae bacterium]|jgi:diguanylate cyclase (GGDEF)-like protein|nr:GGDEF domain-containing protein [Deferribacteraceae bacterium]
MLYKIFTPIPAEMADDFHALQLENSVYRLKLLGVALLIMEVVDTIFYRFVIGFNRGSPILDLLEFLGIAGTIVVITAMWYLSKNGYKRALWYTCHLFIVGCFVLQFLVMFFSDNSDYISAMFMLPIYMFTLVPDFKPKAFILMPTLYFIATLNLLSYHGMDAIEYGGAHSFILNVYLAVMITKILLYNSKVRAFVANKKLERLATKDTLTGINNRRSFFEYAQKIENQSFAILMVDVDFFKRYNDSMGHLEGDNALKAVAKCMQENLPFVARFGGEEFIALIPSADRDEVLNIAQMLVKRVEELKIAHPMSDSSKYLTISVGVAFHEADKTLEQVVDEADKALYAAKQAGRNRVALQ